MKAIVVFTACLPLFFSGCANNPKQPTSIILQHPETKKIMECPLGETCVGVFEELGYVRLEQPTQEQQ